MGWRADHAVHQHGAVKVADESPILTKKALKELLASDPSEVLFFNTAFGLGPGKQMYRGNELDPEYTYRVTGPDPYTSRKWDALVVVKNGKLVITA